MPSWRVRQASTLQSPVGQGGVRHTWAGKPQTPPGKGVQEQLTFSTIKIHTR